MNKGIYVDEKIVLLQEAYHNRTLEYDLLTDKIPIHKKRVCFRWFPLFDGLFRILLPENFMQMPETVAKIRYISSYRPSVIFTGPNYDENFGFHLLEYKNAALDRLIQQMRDAVLRHAPETVVYDEGRVESAVMEGRWFEYKNFTVDEETYNMQFLIHSTSNLLVGTFNCRMIYYDEWKPLVLKLLGMIERVGKERQTDENR